MSRRCCCEDNCTLYYSHFSAASDLDDFTVTGTASVSGSYLEMTGTGTKAICDTVHPQFPYPVTVSGRAFLAEGNVFRVLFSWNATSGYILEVTAPTDPDTTADIKLYHSSSGTETLLSSDTSTVTYGLGGFAQLDFMACYDPRNESAIGQIASGATQFTVARVFSLASIDGTTHADAEYFGLATGSSHSGTAKIDRVYFSRRWYYGAGTEDNWTYADQVDFTVTECPGCGWTCAVCEDDLGPSGWIADVDGIESYNANCSLLNAAWVVVPKDVAFGIPPFADTSCQFTTRYAIDALAGTYEQGGTEFTQCECVFTKDFFPTYRVGFYHPDAFGISFPFQSSDYNILANVYFAENSSLPGYTIPAGYFALVFELQYLGCEGPEFGWGIYWSKHYLNSEKGSLDCRSMSQVELTYRGTTRSSIDLSTWSSGCDNGDYAWEFGTSGGHDDGTNFYPDSSSTVLLTALS